MKRTGVLFLALFVVTGLFAQEKDHSEKDNAQKNRTTNHITLSKKDSLEYGLKEYLFAKRIDSAWLQEIFSSNLYEEMQGFVSNASEYDEEVNTNLSTTVLKERLAKIDAKTPFKVNYNASLEKVINHYLKRNKRVMEKIMELSAYYFPMMEAKLAKYNIPLEIKYLAIVESALKPRAKSWVGATGLWQFMYSTGKMYDLDVNSYVDQRMDPILATEAACKYLSLLHDMFGNWNLALAAYNAGPGNVAQAIRRSGGNKNYWEIRKYLPEETEGYVPAFFATMYLFEYSKEHGYQPDYPEIAYFETDTIHVKKQLSFEKISKVLGVDVDLLEFLNPSYKLNVIPYVEGEDYYLRLPIMEAGLFVANEASIYEWPKQQLAKNDGEASNSEETPNKIYYDIRPGDYLGGIANRYGVSVSDIKDWNNLNGSTINVGENLLIYPNHPATSMQAEEIMYYTVKTGDSLWSISQKFSGISIENIQKWNDISGTHLKPGMTLKLIE